MGRNGAGKSTTMKAIMGLIAQRQRQRSSSTVDDISRLEPYEIARLGLGFTPEDRRIFSDLTVLENLDIGRQPPRRFPTARLRRCGRRNGCSRCFPISAKCRTGPAAA